MKSHEELLALVREIERKEEQGRENVFFTDCRLLCLLMKECEIRRDERASFVFRLSCEEVMACLRMDREMSLKEEFAKESFLEAREARLLSGDNDFSHTAANWKNVLSLGIFGLRERLRTYEEKARGDEGKARFYCALGEVYDSALSLMARMAEEAKAMGKTRMSEGLRNLCHRAPVSLFEALQTSMLYYLLQQTVEGTPLRTLGRWDELFAPFVFEQSGKELLDLFKEYLREVDRWEAISNLPFALGGGEADPRLTMLFLRAYREESTVNTKLHLLCSGKRPSKALDYALEAVREGKNSIVFLSDDTVRRSLEALGEDPEDAKRYEVVGCYECGGREELTCSCNARVNLVKALELSLSDGVDLRTGKRLLAPQEKEISDFEDLLCVFFSRLREVCEMAMRQTDSKERFDGKLHCAPFLTSTYDSALERAGDLYCHHSAKYPNSSVNALGLATAVDSLAAIRRLVWEQKRISLAELTELLRRDWEGEETLRLQIKNRFPKFGNGASEVDLLASRIVGALADCINGRKNAKGGVYRLGLFSINWRWSFGKRTAASADGRKAGEPISQNTGASFGADREGATAHLLSVASADLVKAPNGAIVDLDLHQSAVCGKNGLAAFRGMIEGYFALGGFAVHCNVLDAKVLREAYDFPERYPNLQVRLCGWNVLFSSLAKEEQREFISRFEAKEE